MAQEDTIMSNAPLTPGDDADAEGDADSEPAADPFWHPSGDFSPAKVPYDEDFENSLMNAILNPPSSNPLGDALPKQVPFVRPEFTPYPLASDLRTYPSPIPGIQLTHPNGYHTGGPISPTTVSEFAKKFIEEHGIEDAGQLERVVEEKIREKLEVARQRMREREEAVNRNKVMEKELEDLKVQRAAELRVAEKIKGGRKRRRLNPPSAPQHDTQAPASKPQPYKQRKRDLPIRTWTAKQPTREFPLRTREVKEPPRMETSGQLESEPAVRPPPRRRPGSAFGNVYGRR